MAVVSPPIRIERDRPGTGQGGGGVLPPAFGGGGGDNGPGDGSDDYVRRLNRARLTLLLALTSISILFVTFTVIFALRHDSAVWDRRAGMYVRNWMPVTLPVRLLLVNTFVLLLSSLSIEMARRSVRREMTREMALAPLRGIPGIALDDDGAAGGTWWIATTVTLGLMFLGGQWLAWQALRAHGFHVDSGGASPFVYLLTAAHAVHLAGGILVLLYAGAIFLLLRAVEQRRIVVEVASWYWHFMGVLWVYIFALLEFGR